MPSSFVIIKDPFGFRLAAYTEYDDQSFKLEGGHFISKHEAFIAEPENLVAMATGEKLKMPEELTIPELDEAQVLRFLKKLGARGRTLLKAMRAVAYGFSMKATAKIPWFAGIEASFLARDAFDRASKRPLLVLVTHSRLTTWWALIRTISQPVSSVNWK